MQPARNFDGVDLASTAYGRRGISRAVARMTAKERAERERALLREMGLDRVYDPNDPFRSLDPKVFAELRDRPGKVKEFGTEALDEIRLLADDYARPPWSVYSDYTATTASKAREYFANLRKTQPKLYEKLRKEAEEAWESPELRRWDRMMSPAARALGALERVPAKTAGKLYDAVPRKDDRFAIVRKALSGAENLFGGTKAGEKAAQVSNIVQKVENVVKTPIGRRGFMQLLGGAGAAMAQKPKETWPAPTDWYKKLAGMLKEEGIDFSLSPMWRLERQTVKKGEAPKPTGWHFADTLAEKPSLDPIDYFSGKTDLKRAAQFPGAKLQYTYPQRTPSGNITPEVLTLPAESPFTPERGQAYYNAARRALAGEKPWEEALRKELVQTGIPADTIEKMRLIIQDDFGGGWNIDPASKFAGTVAKARNNLVSGNRKVLEEGLRDIRQHLAQRLASAAEKEAEKKTQVIDNLTKRSNFLRWQDAITHGVSVQNRAPALQQQFLFPADKFRGTPYPKDPRYKQVKRIIEALSGQLDPKIWSKYLRQFD